jgi:hypothetical protein
MAALTAWYVAACAWEADAFTASPALLICSPAMTREGTIAAAEPRRAPCGQAAAAASMMSATGPGFDT